MKITIEEMLVERDIISRQQLERVKRDPEKVMKIKSLTDMLLLLGYTTEDVIMNCFSDRDDMEIIHLEERTADPAAIEMLPESFIVNNEIVPVCLKRGSFSCLRLSCRSGYFRGSGDNLRYDDPAGADTCRPDPEDAVGDGTITEEKKKQLKPERQQKKWKALLQSAWSIR